MTQSSIKQISIFGSTGSIGKNSISLIKDSPQKFAINCLIANNDVKTLISQARELRPKFVAIANPIHFEELRSALCDLEDCEISCGDEAILELAKIRCDLVILAIVGAAGIMPALHAIRAGSNIALANKESLVCAGNFLIEEAQKCQISIIPVDSEHNAIFQIFEQENLQTIEDITLTASGGPFFTSNKNFADISIAEALRHPKWQMGAKISIDSATMMNKGLEMIEAFHLFPIAKNKIKILVHPQSIIHGMVNYSDGASLAMMSLPDMRVPISYALNYPKRAAIEHQKLDLGVLQKLEFFEVDEQKFSAIKLCRWALEAEGSAPIILNASNEIAVSRFLAGEISFDKITEIVAASLDKIAQTKPNSIAEVLEIDRQTRQFALKSF